jgi:hypothetical protein
MAGTPAIFWPFTIAAGVNDKLDIYRGASKVATVAAGTYYSAAALAAAVQAALLAADANSYVVTVTSGGRFQISGSVVWLISVTGKPASLWPALGFDDSIDGAIAKTANRQHANGWYADDPPASDTGDLPVHNRSQAVALGGRVKGLTFGTRYVRTLRLEHLQPHKTYKVDEGAGHINEAMERLIESGWGRFRYWSDAAVPATWADYALDLESAKTLPYDRVSTGHAAYALNLKLLKL